MQRRTFLRNASGAGLAVAAVPMFNRGAFQLFAQSTTRYSARAVELVRRSTVIDMLNPFSLLAVLSDVYGEKLTTWLNTPESFTASDLQRFRDSGINVMHIGAGTGGLNAHADTLKFFGLWNGFIAHHNADFMRIDSAERLDSVKGSGKIGILLGLQNSDHFRNLDDVDFFYNLGQRLSQLTYNTRNLIGSGSTERNDSGLSDFGVSIVDRMNKLGMAVDVAHSGDRTTLDAFDVSRQPVLITHSNARALSQHPRAKSDEAIRKMAEKGGVMGITGVRPFVRATEPTTIEHVLGHYQYVARLVGVEHVGTGSDIDLDGYDALPEPMRKRLHAGYKASYGFREKDDIEGLNHPKRTYDLAEGLIRCGFSDSDTEKILGGNFKRVLAQIWKARAATA